MQIALVYIFAEVLAEFQGRLLPRLTRDYQAKQAIGFLPNWPKRSQV